MRAAAALAACVVVLAAAGAARADAPRAGFRLSRGGQQPHVDVPFFIDLIVEGFDEQPAPAQPALDIKGAQVTPLGATPNVSHGLSIVNGRQQQWSRVSWVLRYRVVAAKEGTLRVPETKVVQGSKSAVADAGELPVDSVPVADDMKLSLELPARPVFVGETVPVKLVWLFRRRPEDQSFAVPMLSLDAFTVSGPPVTDPRKALELPAGAKDLQLPYEIDTTTAGDTRLTLTFFAAPRKTGKVEVPASSVIASLAVGRADFFGQSPTRMFRASDVARALEVRPLPESGRPASFAGAVGDQFAIEVRTSRSVVQLGEPVELDVTIKSNQRLDTLALGRLELPTDKFTVPADQATGTLSDDGKQKAFKVTAQVTGPATEVPAIPFSYFDPTKGTYQTIHSEPIALSVKGGSVVGAESVVAATPKHSAPQGTAQDSAAVGNADLALSSPNDLGDSPLAGGLLWALIALLYAIPLAVLAWTSWAARTRDRREEAAEVKAARKKVEELLDRAGSAPARDVAGPLAAALRELARTLGRDIDDRGGVLAKLETESFAPSAAQLPLSPDLRSDAAGLLRRWVGEARRVRGGAAAKTAATLLVLLCATTAHADALSDGRAAYQDAMAVTSDATARKAAFARAATALAEAARAQPDAPELVTDWGNAALGAGDVATATLAYRRALALDASNQRARTNLAWLRSRQPDTFRPTATTSAAETLLFFHHWPRARRLLVGALAFAIAILLLVPWRRGRRDRTLATLSIVPFAVWLALLASLLLEDRHAGDAIVMDGVVLRAADSAGAPAALTQPLPRGAEVTILEHRSPWTRIQVASGTSGWVQDGAVERVAR